MSASYKVACHLEFYKQSNGEDIGFFTSRDAVCRFRPRLAVFRSDCRMSHSSCDKWDHPPTGFAPSSSSFRSSLRRLYTDSAFHGVYLFPSSRHQLPAEFFYESRIPILDSFAPLAFRTLSTLFATCSLVSLFQPTATSRVHLQGFLPLTQPLKLIAPTVPSRRCSEIACSQLPTYASFFGTALKALLRVRIRSVSLRLFTVTKGRSPLGFSSSRFSPEATFQCLHTFCRPTPSCVSVAVIFACGLWRPSPRLACLSQGCRPARGLGPFHIIPLRS
jgi:hypothetical protein